MKYNFIKLPVMALAMVAFVSCQDTKKEAETEVTAAAEASETAAQYVVDTDNSEIHWTGTKPGTTHFGTIELAGGSIAVVEKQIEAAKFVIAMHTIKVKDIDGEDGARLEAHLKGTAAGKEGDFFDTQKYPEGSFELTGVEGNIVKGNLRIKDKVNPIEFPASVEINDSVLTLTSEPFELDRTQWGINFGSKSVFPNLGDKFIGDNMGLRLRIVAKKA